MYISSLLNSVHCFQKFYSIKRNNDLTFMTTFNEVLSRGTSAILSIKRINELNNICVSEFNLFEDQLNIKDERIVFSSESLGYLLNEIPVILSVLIILQNLQMRVLRSLTGKDLPKSLADYFKNPTKYGIDINVHNILEKHWKSKGKKLRDYRDIDQHYSILTENYFINVNNQKTIEVLFPDNPEIKSLSKFSFNNKINGIFYIIDSFSEIHDVFEEIADIFSGTEQVIQESINMNQLGELCPPRQRTLSFLFDKEMTFTNEICKMNIKGLEIGQDNEGHITLRECLLSQEKLNTLL